MTMPASPLRLFNSLTRQIEDFQPICGNEARVYSCGPTVYNYPHIGNMRAYVFADTLGRVLRWKGYHLRHVINITDVGHLTDDADAGEDKMEKMALSQRRTAREIANYYTQAYWADFRALNCSQPAEWSIATDYVPRMIDFAKGIAAKHCYQLDSGLYFDTSTVPDYGRLAPSYGSDRKARIEEVEGKRNEVDFAIWRKTPPGETRQMEWDSPWGRGAPGWHLECSVMSGTLLGFPFDIHTGGIDHREVHHPCEIAQNQAHCSGADTGARIWMHNNFLIDRTGKMSKSAGEFLRLQTLIDRGFHPLSYRLMCLQAHYRSELEFSWENLLAAQVRLKRMAAAMEKIQKNTPSISGWIYRQLRRNSINAVLQKFDDQRLDSFVDEFELSICDDLNTAAALTVAERLMFDRSMSYPARMVGLTIMDGVLGLKLRTLSRRSLRRRYTLSPAPRTLTNKRIEAALARRVDCRAAKDFATSDRIRDELAAAGVEVMDGDPLGWDWKIEL